MFSGINGRDVSNPDADRVIQSQIRIGLKEEQVIGVSALNKQTYEAIAHGVSSIGGKPKWVERSSPINLAASVTAICIDADSLDATLERRITWVRSQIAHAPLIVLMNFPRRQEIEALNKLGVKSVVSKPFELIDLQSAIEKVTETTKSAINHSRGPSFSKRRTSTENVK